MRHMLLAGVAVICLGSSAAMAADLKFAPGQDAKFNWASYEEFKKAHGDIKGQSLTIFGPWRGDDEKLFRSVLAYFNDATGANVQYSSSENYEQQIVIDTQAGSPPNIAILPQPGLLQDLASKGLLTPLKAGTSDWVKTNYGAGDSWVKLGTYKGKDGKDAFFAFPYKADLKSLVWYVPENFEEAGYKVPKTMEELYALSDQIVKDGGTPWCIGLGSGGATGWPATDWVEDLMLRMNTPDTYDQWVTNQTKFNDRRSSASSRNSASSPRTRSMFRVAWRPSPRRLPRQPQRSLRHSAEVLPASPGLVHPDLLPGRHEARHGCGLLLHANLCGKA